MIEVVGNIFDLAYTCEVPTILLVPTNGCLDSHGRAVLGAGFAKAVKEYFPECSSALGTCLRTQYERLKHTENAENLEPWNIPYKIGRQGDCHLFSFPTKATYVTMDKALVLPRYFSQQNIGQKTEGWKGYSQLSLIERSARYIVGIVENSKIQCVFSTRPGTSNGGLHWSQVKPLLEKFFFDDRFIIVSREGDK